MPRPWGKLHAPMLSHRKFLQMSRAERGDWLLLVLVAINSTKDADLGTQDDVKAVLKAYGNLRSDDTIAQMLNLNLVDLRSDGHLVLHDWADHQPDDPTGAKRKAAERAAAKAALEGLVSADSRRTVAGQSQDVPETVTGLSSDLSRARSRDGDGDGDGDSPPPPTSGGRRSNGTNPRAVADAERAVLAAESRGREWRRQQRHLAYSRGAISEDVLDRMNKADSLLSDIPDWESHQADLRAGNGWMGVTVEH